VSDKTSLIFGISGQDGSYLSQFLLSKGYKIHGTTRQPANAEILNHDRLGIQSNITIHTVNPVEFDEVNDIINKVAPQECYLLCGQSSVGRSFEQPLESYLSITMSTINVLESIRRSSLPVRLFNAGSIECFGETETPTTALSPFDPRNPYAAAKASAILAVRTYRQAYGLFSCSGILSNHESPLRDSKFVTKKIVLAAVRIANEKSGKLQLGNINVCRDWGWAPEFVEAFWKILQAEKPDDYVIATGESWPLSEFINCVFSQLGLDWRKHVEIDATFMRPTDIANTVLDVEKAATELGWSAKVRMLDVVKQMVDDELKQSAGSQ